MGIYKRLNISDITVKNRFRKDFGDLEELASSIKEFGLLQPIGITKEGYKLIFGERRLRAVKLNGDDVIDCHILDLKNILGAENAENEYRKNLTHTEKLALAEALEEEAAKIERRGRPAKEKSVQAAHNNSETAEQRKTRTKIAAKAGFNSPDEMRRVKKVVKEGDEELVEAMDKGKIPVSTAAKIASNPNKKEQKEELERYKKNGKLSSGKSQAVLWGEKMRDILMRVWGIKEQYGGVFEMINSKQWQSSTDEEWEECVELTKEAAQELTNLAEEMSNLQGE